MPPLWDNLSMRRGLLLLAFVLLILLDLMFVGRTLAALGLTIGVSMLGHGPLGNGWVVLVPIVMLDLALASGLIWLTVAVGKRIS
jgi:hypothetical protein